MAIGSGPLQEMLDVCKENDVELIISHQRRFTPGWEKAKEIVEFRKSNSNSSKKLIPKDKTTLFEKKDSKEELNIIIKSDVQGSSEALKNAVNKIEHEEVKANIILSYIGKINETDVLLAKASNALLIGFNVKPNREAKKLAEEQNIDIKLKLQE